ncbi:hypothetical protein GALMADRAFT_713594 [Galerina marginata CBS 339.88]|uniref:Uncharacterized protein n=1 Tax=Galerina marginata (strain CBS 339.88) TaxID=685588 RepID=A0A067TMU0_GALM3|nr:hypothetical protein GALMADRAFT_713594 [Galerina marginata CBS 339.88]
MIVSKTVQTSTTTPLDDNSETLLDAVRLFTSMMISTMGSVPRCYENRGRIQNSWRKRKRLDFPSYVPNLNPPPRAYRFAAILPSARVLLGRCLGRVANLMTVPNFSKPNIYRSNYSAAFCRHLSEIFQIHDLIVSKQASSSSEAASRLFEAGQSGLVVHKENAARTSRTSNRSGGGADCSCTVAV